VPIIDDAVENVPAVVFVTMRELPLNAGLLDPHIVMTSPLETGLPTYEYFAVFPSALAVDMNATGSELHETQVLPLLTRTTTTAEVKMRFFVALSDPLVAVNTYSEVKAWLVEPLKTPVVESKFKPTGNTGSTDQVTGPDA
jgi:hypothetical protein